MAKTKTVFFCSNCGTESPKWEGKCAVCGEWNTYVQKTINTKNATTDKHNELFPQKENTPVKIQDIQATQNKRIDTQSSELNRVLGGGLVLGSLILIGGEPGIGKSTLALQIALKLSQKTLYVSGEESLQQIMMRAKRLNDTESNCLILSETNLEAVLSQVKEVQPDIVVIDSIQTLYSEHIEAAQGSITQVRACSGELMKVAKTQHIPIIIIGHVTKDGYIAGPKILEHMVDTVIQFEGDQHNQYRVLRAAKNRFGSTSELGIFEMKNDGLREVLNPSEILLSQNKEEASGTAISSTIEGARPFLVEVQALVSTAAYGTPQRSATGFDTRRLNMILAVLEKRVGFKLAAKDVFLNIAGGIRVYDPAIDLAVIVAILSSSIDVVIPNSYCFTGEVGLSGEVRNVSKIEQRIKEAEKLGFEKIFIPKGNFKENEKSKVKIVAVGKVSDVFRMLFQ